MGAGIVAPSWSGQLFQRVSPPRCGGPVSWAGSQGCWRQEGPHTAQHPHWVALALALGEGAHWCPRRLESTAALRRLTIPSCPSSTGFHCRPRAGQRDVRDFGVKPKAGVSRLLSIWGVRGAPGGRQHQLQGPLDVRSPVPASPGPKVTAIALAAQLGCHLPQDTPGSGQHVLPPPLPRWPGACPSVPVSPPSSVGARRPPRPTGGSD